MRNMDRDSCMGRSNKKGVNDKGIALVLHHHQPQRKDGEKEEEE